MFSVRIEDTFAAAHFLPQYHGKCENLHGHNYRVRVTIQGQSLDDEGMLIDFGILKKALKEVLAEFDHSLLNEHAAFKDTEPSAERIAYYIHGRVQSRFPLHTVSLVEVFETDINRAAYSPD